MSMPWGGVAVRISPLAAEDSGGELRGRFEILEHLGVKLRDDHARHQDRRIFEVVHREIDRGLDVGDGA